MYSFINTNSLCSNYYKCIVTLCPDLNLYYDKPLSCCQSRIILCIGTCCRMLGGRMSPGLLGTCATLLVLVQAGKSVNFILFSNLTLFIYSSSQLYVSFNLKHLNIIKIFANFSSSISECSTFIVSQKIMLPTLSEVCSIFNE